MKKYLLLIGILLTGIAAFAQSERLKLSAPTQNELSRSLSLPEFDALAECILIYSQLDKDSLNNLAASGVNTVDCIALKFGFNKAQQAELHQAIQSLIAAETNVVPDVYLDKLVLILSDNIQRKRNGEVPTSQPTVTTKDRFEQQFGVLLAVIGGVSIGFLMLFLSNLKKIKALKKTGTGIFDLETKKALNQRLTTLEEGNSNLKSSLEKIKNLESSVIVLKAELEAIIKKLGEVKSGSVKSGTTISAIVNSPEPAPKTSVIYTQAPRNGLFIKVLDQFIPRSTFYQIEINPQRNNIGEFTLVNDTDTQQIAFNIPDTYLPNEACEIRNAGGPISTQRKWKILSKGQVERQNAAWKIIKPMIIEFE